MRLLINHHYIMYRGWKLTSGYEYLLSRAYHTYVNLTSPYNYFYANEMMKEVSYIFILGGLYSEIYHTLMITRELDRREHVFGLYFLLLYFSLFNIKKSKDLDISSSIYKIAINNIFHFPFSYRFNRL